MKHPKSQGPTLLQGYSYCVPDTTVAEVNSRVCLREGVGAGGQCREMCGPPHSALRLYPPGLCQPPLWSSSHQHFITLWPVFHYCSFTQMVHVLRWGSLPSIAKTPHPPSHTHKKKISFLGLHRCALTTHFDLCKMLLHRLQGPSVFPATKPKPKEWNWTLLLVNYAILIRLRHLMMVIKGLALIFCCFFCPLYQFEMRKCKITG